MLRAERAMHRESAMRVRAFAIGLALAVSPASLAIADDDPQAVPPPRWYGWQTLLADAGVAGVWGLAARTSGDGSTALAWLGVFGYLGAAPTIHAVHGEGPKGALSIALRLGVPLIGGILGMAAATCQPPPAPKGAWLDLGGLDCLGVELQGGVYGAAAGAAVASIFDAVGLAWKSRADPEFTPPDVRTTGVQWLPTVSVARDAGRRAAPMLGIGGVF